MQESESELRAELRGSGAKDLVPHKLLPTDKPRKLLQYHTELNGGPGTSYQDVLLGTFFGAEKVSFIRTVVPSLFDNLLRLSRSPTRKLSLGLSSSGNGNIPSPKAVFSQAALCLKTLGAWNAIFFGQALLLERPSICDYSAVLTAANQYCEHNDSGDLSWKDAAASLAQFLHTHRTCPDGLAVGRRVSDALAESVMWSQQDMVCRRCVNPVPWADLPAASDPSTPGLRKGGSRKSLSGSSWRASPKSAEKNDAPVDGLLQSQKNASASQSNAVDAILGWAELEDDGAVAAAVRAYAESLRWSMSVLSMKVGDLVMVRFRESEEQAPVVRLGRLVRLLDPKTVVVFLDALETIQWEVPSELVSRLTESMRQSLSFHNRKGSEGEDWNIWKANCAQLFHPSETHEISAFSKVVQEYLAKSVMSLLSSYNVDDGLLKRKEVQVCDLPNLLLAKKVLDEEQVSVVKYGYGELILMMEQHADQVLAALDLSQFFIPSRRYLIETLVQTPQRAKEMLEDAISVMSMRVQCRIDLLAPRIQAIWSGERKRALVTWWLGFIRSSVSLMLKSCGFLENVTSENYINDPPIDFAGVRSNDKILSRLLEDWEARVPGSEIMVLIDQLKAEISPKIKAYIADSSTILAVDLNVASSSCSLETAKLILSERKASMDPAAARRMTELIQDLEYLQQMLALDDPSSSQERSAHVVPISGLALSRIVRLAQEMRTVIDVWSDREIAVLRMSTFSSLSSKSQENETSEDQDDSSQIVLAEDLDLEEVRKLYIRLRRIVRPQNLVFQGNLFRDVFVGQTVIDMLVAGSDEPRSVWTSRCASLLSCGYMISCSPGMPFRDGYELYQWTDRSKPPKLSGKLPSF